MYKQDLTLNILQVLICQQTQPTNVHVKPILLTLEFSYTLYFTDNKEACNLNRHF